MDLSEFINKFKIRYNIVPEPVYFENAPSIVINAIISNFKVGNGYLVLNRCSGSPIHDRFNLDNKTIFNWFVLSDSRNIISNFVTQDYDHFFTSVNYIHKSNVYTWACKTLSDTLNNAQNNIILEAIVNVLKEELCNSVIKYSSHSIYIYSYCKAMLRLSETNITILQAGQDRKILVVNNYGIAPDDTILDYLSVSISENINVVIEFCKKYHY